MSDTGIVAADTVLMAADSIVASVSDSSAKKRLEDSLGIRISPDALPSRVTAEASDSAVLDMTNHLFYLYGSAKVDYEDLKLSAGQIVYEQNTSTITAQPVFDSSGVMAQRPTFVQGSETVTYDSLQYNFKSKRAIIRNARSQYGEGFVHSQQVKRNPDQSIYGWQNVYTTCSLDTPHFGIHAHRIKVVPNKVIASASANIVIEQVPTPFFIPFGLFPISSKQRSGFQIPSYTIEQQRGFGLTNGGYYFHFNDYVDFLVLTNIFTKGSWSASGISSYTNRYKYNGSASVSYAYNKTGESYEPDARIDKSFMIDWIHRTDPKARPGVSLTALVKVGSSSFYANNSYNADQILNNQFASSITFSKNWIGKPYSLTVGARHSQNTQTRLVDLSFPELNFYVSQFNPFQNKRRVGAPRWYEKISASYNFSALNQTSFYDSTFNLNTLSLNDFRNGFKHSLPISAAYNVFRFINLSFGTTYTEYWMTNRRFRYYNTGENKLDTIEAKGFFTGRDFNANVQMSSRIYGVKFFKRGKLMGVRHVVTPTVGLTYTPDFAAPPFRYYYQTRLDTTPNTYYLSPFEGSVIGTPGMNQYGNFASNVNFGIGNNLQIKVRSKGDSTGQGRNITLIDGLSITSAYNIAADSFNWSTFNISFRTNILDKLNITAGAVYDPYGINYETGRRSSRTMWQEGRGIARFQNANVAMQAEFSGKPTESGGAAAESDEYKQLMQYGGYNDYVDFKIPWTLRVAYSLGVNNQLTYITRRDTLLFNQSLRVDGDFNITSRWKVGIHTGYEFVTKSLNMTSIEVYRDLHCWQMRLQLIPNGPRKSFTFTLNVKASILQDLRLIRRRDYRDVTY